MKLDALVTRVQQGDWEAFDLLVLACLRDLRWFVATRTPSIDLVEEVVQATLVMAYQCIASYQLRDCFLPWLKGIARNLLLQELRARSRYHHLSGEVLEAAVTQAADHRISAVAQHDDDREGAPDRTRLQQCLERLTPRARSLIERHHVDGVPLARLAQQFKQSTASIASLLKRLRRRLRLCLESS